MSTITKTVTVQLQKTITISLPEEYSEPSIIEQWSNFIYPVKSIDDVFKYVAELAATGGAGASWNGIGELVEVDDHQFTDDAVCFSEDSTEITIDINNGDNNE